MINGWHVAPSLDDSGEKIVSIQIARAGVGFTSMTTVSGYTNLDRFSCRPAKLQAPKKLIYLNPHTPVVPSIFFPIHLQDFAAQKKPTPRFQVGQRQKNAAKLNADMVWKLGVGWLEDVERCPPCFCRWKIHHPQAGELIGSSQGNSGFVGALDFAYLQMQVPRYG